MGIHDEVTPEEEERLAERAADPSSLVQKHEAQDAVRFDDEPVEITLPDGEVGGQAAPDA